MQLEPAPTPRWPGRRTEAIVLLVILAVAAFFRFYRLDSIPPGFTHDEAGHGADAIAIAQGARPIYETVGYGREPLYDYVVAAAMPILGQNYLTLRLISAAAGLLLIVVTHFWVRRAFDVPTALVTSTSLAVSFWAISTSRQALRSELLPAIFMAMIYFMWQALRPFERQTPLTRLSLRVARWSSLLMAGVLLGLSLYTYLAARVLPVILILLWFYLLLFQRDVWRRNWLGLIGIVAIGLAAAAPMFTYLAAHPGAEVRVSQLSGPIDQLFSGKPDELLSNAVGALGMFSVSGDSLWLYNVPGRPILDWPLAIMFYIGLGVAVLRFRKTEFALALGWLIAAIVPSLLTGVVASSLRSIAAQPIVYVFVGIGYVQLARWIDRVVASHTLRSIPLVVLLIAVTVYTYHDYFDVWGQARDVRVAYHANLAAMARYLDGQPADRIDVAISSIYPQRFHDPYSMKLLQPRQDLTLRWFTGSFADAAGAPHASLIFPAPLNDTVDVLLPAIAPIDPAFAGLFARHAQQTATIDLRPDDFNPRFDVYRFDAAAALAGALKAGVMLARTLDVDHTFTLIGYDVRTPQARPGEVVTVITYWRITSITHKEFLLFTHLLSADSNRRVLAQQDSLDVPSWYWVPGDAFAQAHRFVVPSDVKPGAYPLEVGAYTPGDNQRATLFDEAGRPLGDHLLIGSITVLP